MSLTTKVTVTTFSFLNEKSYNKTVIDFNFGRHKDLSILKSDIHLGLAASVNHHFRVDKSLSTSLKSIIGECCDRSFKTDWQLEMF